MVRTSRQQELAAAGHMARTVRRWRVVMPLLSTLDPFSVLGYRLLGWGLPRLAGPPPAVHQPIPSQARPERLIPQVF